MKVWMDGQVFDDAEARVPVTDTAVLFGEGLFETLRVRAGRAVQMDAHLARLEASTQALRLALQQTRNQLKQAIQETIAANAIETGVVRLTVTGGDIPSRDFLATDRPARCFIIGNAMSLALGDASAVLVRSPFPWGAELTRHKTLCYLPNLQARRAAAAAGADEALLVADGRILEGAMSNFFMVVDGMLRTAPVEDGVLPGIVRATVLRLAGEQGIPVEERAVLEDELPQASECFCTNSLIGVQPLTRIEDRWVATGGVGEVTQRLREGYERIVEASVSGKG